jgi:UDP-N-acetylglucosamine--dolichyl-phosphate N-acetylglucosaminephosphotransferase
MAAGYNGLESGIAIITSSFMALITFIKGSNHGSTLIFLGLAGAATALWIFNRFPSKVFVGDIGTLGFGATYAVGAIVGNVSIYAIIAILPMFYNLGENASHPQAAGL